MLTGPIEGRFLEFLVWMTGARRILELGDVQRLLVHLDGGRAPAGRAHRHARWTRRTPRSRAATSRKRASADRITVHVGPALESIGRLEGEFDFVFIDADKANYVNYYEACFLGSPSAV